MWGKTGTIAGSLRGLVYVAFVLHGLALGRAWQLLGRRRGACRAGAVLQPTDRRDREKKGAAGPNGSRDERTPEAGEAPRGR